MATFDIFGVSVEANDEEWRDMLSEVTMRAFEKADVDPDEDEDLFFDIKYDTIESLIESAVDEALGKLDGEPLHEIISEAAAAIERSMQ